MNKIRRFFVNMVMGCFFGERCSCTAAGNRDNGCFICSSEFRLWNYVQQHWGWYYD